MVFSMGFGTNASIFSALVSKGCLIISDELNHASIRFGTRLSGASITMFKHNDVKALEKRLREAISQGQPRTHRPWKKILVVVEGLYSMEGSLCNLPGILALKKKYKFNLFIDEAHSIGAIGPRGRGICDFFGIDTKHVDILMGTLTKSFGANGGYIAADKIIIDKLRATNPAVFYGETPTPPVLAQISSSLKIITGELIPGQGEERLQRLAFNSRYLRLGLKRLGFIVYGNDDSPVIPLLLFNPAKMPAFSHEMLKRKISVVIVGYPATPLVSSRARFCVSAAHTKDDLDRLLAACDEIGNVLQLKFSSGVAGGALPPPDGMTPEMETEWYRQQAAASKEPSSPPRWRYEDVIARALAGFVNQISPDTIAHSTVEPTNQSLFLPSIQPEIEFLQANRPKANNQPFKSSNPAGWSRRNYPYTRLRAFAWTRHKVVDGHRSGKCEASTVDKLREVHTLLDILYPAIFSWPNIGSSFGQNQWQDMKLQLINIDQMFILAYVPSKYLEAILRAYSRSRMYVKVAVQLCATKKHGDQP
ncbi:serine palmitoyltransferase component [Arthroderma sp. PD_2]|nr:serine palmitoyltransferase component [Arthroderma sp. PD_2]